MSTITKEIYENHQLINKITELEEKIYELNQILKRRTFVKKTLLQILNKVSDIDKELERINNINLNNKGGK